jgi:inosine-uridine nucleoside N-ribohydrolase
MFVTSFNFVGAHADERHEKDSILASLAMDVSPARPRGRSFHFFARQNKRADGMTDRQNRLARPVVIISDLTLLGDDSIAILMLLNSDVIDVKGIMTTSGNVWADKAASNAAKLLSVAGRKDLSLEQGLPQDWHTARAAHFATFEKKTMLSDAYVGAFKELPAEGNTGLAQGATEHSATTFLIDLARDAGGALNIVLLGPATLLAETLKKSPELSGLIKMTYVMGGTLNVPGNVTPHAEFNLWFDPEAMQKVLKSGLSITLLPLDAILDLTYGSVLVDPPAGKGPAAVHLKQYLASRGSMDNVKLWDEVLAAVVMDDSVIAVQEKMPLTVHAAKDEYYGALERIPSKGSGHNGSIRVVTKVHEAKVRRLLVGALDR